MFGIGDAFSAAVGWFGAEQQNRRQADAAEAANTFSAQQFATRYQTTTADMKAAGLNPMLAYSQGGGSPPSGQQANVPANSGESAVRSYSANASTELIKAQVDNVEADSRAKRAQAGLFEAQTGASGASADQSRASIGFMEHQSRKIIEEIKNIPKEGNRLDALVDQLKSSKDLLDKQGLTQVEQAKQLKELARKAVHEANLAKFDENAAVDSNNMGRDLNEYKLIIEALRDFIPTNVLGKLFKKGR
ncbi:MAG: DNA pilot protein [Microviridae sp.]|nr:MAG: DNA pilot protein [Microviridae sp.]